MIGISFTASAGIDDWGVIIYFSQVDQTTFNTLFNGIRYDDLPIIHVKCSMNNTLCTLCQPNGIIVAIRSGGTEGFKHTKKGMSRLTHIVSDKREWEQCLEGIFDEFGALKKSTTPELFLASFQALLSWQPPTSHPCTTLVSPLIVRFRHDSRSSSRGLSNRISSVPLLDERRSSHHQRFRSRSIGLREGSPADWNQYCFNNW